MGRENVSSKRQEQNTTSCAKIWDKKGEVCGCVGIQMLEIDSFENNEATPVISDLVN